MAQALREVDSDEQELSTRLSFQTGSWVMLLIIIMFDAVGRVQKLRHTITSNPPRSLYSPRSGWRGRHHSHLPRTLPPLTGPGGYKDGRHLASSLIHHAKIPHPRLNLMNEEYP